MESMLFLRFYDIGFPNPWSTCLPSLILLIPRWHYYLKQDLYLKIRGLRVWVIPLSQPSSLLGDLGRYRMAIEDIEPRNREV